MLSNFVNKPGQQNSIKFNSYIISRHRDFVLYFWSFALRALAVLQRYVTDICNLCMLLLCVDATLEAQYAFMRAFQLRDVQKRIETQRLYEFCIIYRTQNRRIVSTFVPKSIFRTRAHVFGVFLNDRS